LSRAVKASRPLIALSTASVFPDSTPDAFEVAARLGYDGVEVMVSADAVSQDVDVLRRLVDYHGVPVLAVHAPCLLITQRVWGREPWGKLIRAKEVAEKLDARVVVVHPPFRWQRDYARDFGPGLERMSEETDVVFAVENMYPLRAGGAEVAAYAPNWNPVQMDVSHVTLDLSHTAASGSDALAMAEELGNRLAHVHMADGTGVTNRDEHLVPGRGAQPCAPLLEKLAADGYRGMVVLEVNTRRAISREARLADLAEALEFTGGHLGRPAPAGDGHARVGDGRTRAGSMASRAAPPEAIGPGVAGTGTGTAGTGTADMAGTDASGMAGTDASGMAGTDASGMAGTDASGMAGTDASGRAGASGGGSAAGPDPVAAVLSACR
jgi:sugar phosphate isomerase/epimerase